MTKAVNIAQSAASGVTVGFRNKVINGAMVIDQRNAGAAQTGLSSSGYFFCDRFRTGGGTWSTLRFTLQQVTDAPTGFIKSGKFTVTTAQSAGAADNLSCTHIIEGNNITDLNWGTANAAAVTLSFWVKSSATGTFGVIIGNDSNWYYPATYTISAANTWEQKTITITGPTSGTWSSTNTSGIRIDFGLGFGSNSSGGTANAWTSTYAFTSSSSSITGTLNVTWQVTGVQLEVGTTATNFDYRPYGTELQLCQRYYEKSFDIDTAPANGPNATSTATSNGEAGGAVSNNLAFGGKVTYAVSKRAVPTLTAYGNSSGYWWYISPTSTSSGVTWSASTQIFAKQGTSGFAFSQNVLGNTLLIVGGHWTASAEL